MSDYSRDPEALAWAREKVAKQIDFIGEMADHLTEKGEADRADGYRQAAERMRSMLIGGSGCVVGAFDERLPEALRLIDQASSR